VDISVSDLAAGHLERFLAALETGGQKCVQTMALTGQSLVQHRIQEKGVPGKKYSKNKLPAFFFDDVASTAAGRKAVEDADDDGISYEDFRVADGKQVGHVDLTFSGRMFGGTRIIRILTSGATFVAQVGGTDEEVDAKLGYAIAHYGPNVFDPTLEEQQEIDEIAEDFLSNLFNEFL
jgi:hypothetical protein